MRAGKLEVIVVSDFHLEGAYYFPCSQPNAIELMGYVKKFMKDRPFELVFNGDIFEGTHTALKKKALQAKIRETIKGWLAELPNASIHYILGNHDDTKPVVKTLREIEEENDKRFYINEVYLKAGDLLITHGDISDDNERRKNYGKNTRDLRGENQSAKFIEDLIDKGTGLPKPPTLFTSSVTEPPELQEKFNNKTRKLLDLLDRQGLLKKVEHVIIGHIHRPVLGLSVKEYPEVKIYNTGATIAGASAMPLFIKVGDDGRAEKICPLPGYLPVISAPASGRS